MSNVILKGHIVVPDADLIAVGKELAVHIKLTRKEAGCLAFEVTQDKNDKNKFHVYEEFDNAAAFSKHQQRVGRSDWGRVTVNVERFYEVTGLDD